MATDSTTSAPPATTPSSAAQRIIAIGIVLAFLFWASSVVIAVLLAVLFAYLLDPAVSGLHRMHIPRVLGALLVLLAAGAALGAVGYLLVDRVQSFADEWPRYSAVLRSTADTMDRKLNAFQGQVSGPPPRGRVASPPQTRLEDELPSIRTILLQGIGSLYSAMFVWTFLPFLIFFMLATKTKIWRATVELFPDSQRKDAKEALDQVGKVLRSYVAGNILVCVLLRHSPRLSVPDGAGFRHLQPGSLLGHGAGLGAAVSDGLGEVEDDGAVFWRRRRAQRPALACHQRAHARHRGTPRALERAGGHYRAVVLGMALGRARPALGDSHHRDDQSDL
jgi:AI-2E family transporter